MSEPDTTTMAPRHILDLEVEILAGVFQCVDDESPRTTSAVAQVCKYFNSAVKLVQYRRLTVRWDQEHSTWVTLTGRSPEEWQTPEFLQGLRHLTIHRGGMVPENQWHDLLDAQLGLG